MVLDTPTLFEAAMVLESRADGLGATMVADFIVRFEVAVVNFTPAHWEAAFDAWLKYGKGRHPARLNFGDCMSYTVAKLARLPLLDVGQDFARTDVKRA